MNKWEKSLDPVKPPTKPQWRQKLDRIGCNCTDPWRLECLNNKTGNYACTCGCHRGTL